jgi:UDP-N-acetylmuramoylalanine--D-glutamate ligase
MKARPSLPEGPFLVVGLARSGAAIAHLLRSRGERVIGVDSGAPESAAGLGEAGVEVHVNEAGTDLFNEIRDEVKTVVKSPGVPQDAPVIAAARQRSIPVTGELELAWRSLANRFVAVTGTNGKTTTTELIGHLLRTAGEPVAVAGNVGTPLAALVGEVDEQATVVCECSSFQLEDTEAFAPECGVFLNLAPDHLDRHGTVADYLDAKLQIFANQGRGDIAVVNGAEPALAEIELPDGVERVIFNPDGPGAGGDVTIEAGEIRWHGEPLVLSAELHLLGPHNVANAMAAAAAALAIGLPLEAVAEGLRSFEGVAHRLEPVGALDGVLYVNDSKATNVAAALAAVNAFEGGIHLILGGQRKEESLEPLAAAIAERVVAAYLVGESAGDFEKALAPTGVEMHRAEGLNQAVALAAEKATAGQVVLLAPAAASFDAYPDFEARGDHFRQIVEALA